MTNINEPQSSDELAQEAEIKRIEEAEQAYIYENSECNLLENKEI